MAGSIQQQKKYLEDESWRSYDHPWTLVTSFYRAKVVTVEPVIFMIVLSKYIYTPLCEQYYYLYYGKYILQNTSFSFPNQTFCMSSELMDNYTGSNSSYKLDQTYSNHLVAYGEIADRVPSILIAILLGPLSNRFGRKIGLILPAIGYIVLGVFSFIIMKFNLNPYYFILARFLCGISGSETSVIASVFTYIADISSPRWRSFRIGAVEMSIAIGSCAGQLLGGFWFHKIQCEYSPIMLFFIGTNVLTLIYVVLLLPESLTHTEREQMRDKNPKGVREYVEGLRLFSCHLSFSSTWALYVGLISIAVISFNKPGAYLISLYFLKAPPFEFNSLQIGLFQGLRSGSQGLANILFVGILVALRVKDVWIVFVAMSFHGVCNILVGLSTKAWEVYAVSAVQGMEGTVFTGSRSIMSKLVNPEQQGALFSIVASLESLSALASSVSWPLVYPLTLKHNLRPGMSYIFMGAVGILCVPLIMTLFLFREDLNKNAQRISRYSSSSESSDSEEEEYKPLLTSTKTYA